MTNSSGQSGRKGLESFGLPKVIADRVTALVRSGDIAKAQGVLIGFGAVVDSDEFIAASLIEFLALVEMERRLQVTQALYILSSPSEITEAELNTFYAEGVRRLDARQAATLKTSGVESFDELVNLFTGVDNGTAH